MESYRRWQLWTSKILNKRADSRATRNSEIDKVEVVPGLHRVVNQAEMEEEELDGYEYCRTG